MAPNKTRTGPNVIRRAQRRELAVRLRASGLTVIEVARVLKVSEVTARRDIVHELDKLADVSERKAAYLRELTGARLEQLVAEWSDRARDDPMAAGILLKTLEQRARLYGLNAQQGMVRNPPPSAVNINLIPPPTDVRASPEVIEMRPVRPSDGTDSPRP